jgi:hypothetical protein
MVGHRDTDVACAAAAGGAHCPCDSNRDVAAGNAAAPPTSSTRSDIFSLVFCAATAIPYRTSPVGRSLAGRSTASPGLPPVRRGSAARPRSTTVMDGRRLRHRCRLGESRWSACGPHCQLPCGSRSRPPETRQLRRRQHGPTHSRCCRICASARFGERFLSPASVVVARIRNTVKEWHNSIKGEINAKSTKY